MRLRNLSRMGVGLRHARRIRRGGTVKLVFGNGVERRGAVRWANDEQAGLLLLEPLAPHELACAADAEPARERGRAEEDGRR